MSPVRLGLLAADAFAVPQLQAGDVAGGGVVQQFVQDGDLLLRQRHGQFAHVVEAEAEIGAEVVPHLVAFPLQPAFERGGGGVVAAVDDAGVGLARAEAGLDLLFDQGQLKPVA